MFWKLRKYRTKMGNAFRDLRAVKISSIYRRRHFTLSAMKILASTRDNAAGAFVSIKQSTVHYKDPNIV